MLKIVLCLSISSGTTMSDSRLRLFTTLENAVALAYGLETGGAAEARASLDRFWHGVAEASRFSPIRLLPIRAMLSLDRSNAGGG